MDKYITGNREAWNVASVYHQKTMADKWLEGYKTPGYTSFDEFDYNLYNRLPFEGRSVFQAPCNNGREILSFINMGASEGVGFDISSVWGLPTAASNSSVKLCFTPHYCCTTGGCGD